MGRFLGPAILLGLLYMCVYNNLDRDDSLPYVEKRDASSMTPKKIGVADSCPSTTAKKMRIADSCPPTSIQKRPGGIEKDSDAESRRMGPPLIPKATKSNTGKLKI